mgnify:CR=1 FL=1
MAERKKITIKLIKDMLANNNYTEIVDTEIKGFKVRLGKRTTTLIIRKKHNKKAAISVKPKTPIEEIYKYLDRCDMVLIMTVEPGYGGQAFMPEMLEKVGKLRAEINKRNLPVKVQTDGGIDENTVAKVAENGSNVVVAGTAVFRHVSGMKYAIDKLHCATKLLDSAL